MLRRGEKIKHFTSSMFFSRLTVFVIITQDQPAVLPCGQTKTGTMILV